ncbi:hypothetical protein ACWEQ1_29535 [Streptomyces nodosus]
MTTDTATDTATAGTTAEPPDPAGPRWHRPTGRHRKPRRRRMVLAVGGFALAAGALSLVRLASESATGGSGTAEAEPRIQATRTAATAGSQPAEASGHPATSALTEAAGGPGVALDTADPTTSPAIRPSSSAPPASAASDGTPEAPSAPTTTSPGHEPPTTTTPAAPPAPSATTTAQAPAPDLDPDPGGLCLPIIGLCVNVGVGTDG